MESAKSLINFNTNQAKKTRSIGKPRILLAPLDWGLGHTTRCIAVTRELLNQGAEVLLAGNESQAAVLLNEFPEVPIIPLDGYNIRYSNHAAGFSLSIIRQLIKIRNAVKSEYEWLKKMLQQYEIDAVISDNRYGLYNEAIHSVFITHQLTIKSPFGKWNEQLLQKWNYKYINRFSECWIPDSAGKENLAGDLSHPEKKPAIPVSYIGLLSRLERKIKKEKTNHLLVILSGPEPQRSILEDKLINEIVHYNGTADVVRGLPVANMLIPSTNQIRFYNHLPAIELNEKIEEAEFVISRCGYSTVMDLVKLQKKSILIPTPGQTEQEYLAHYLSGRKIAYCMNQNELSLERNLQQAKNFNYHFTDIDNSLQETISNFLLKLKKS